MVSFLKRTSNFNVLKLIQKTDHGLRFALAYRTKIKVPHWCKADSEEAAKEKVAALQADLEKL